MVKKSDLAKKIIKSAKNPYMDMLMDTELLNKKELTSTPIPAFNIALSGDVKGGFDSGVITLGGTSKSFKSLFALQMAKSYLNKYDDAILVFFDSEFGSPRSYFKSFGDAQDRIIHTPVSTIEDLRTQMMNILDSVEREDKVIFILDSIGNLASIKEAEDALDGKNTVDMTRAKMVKSLFRLVTPQLSIKDKTLIVVAHVYSTMEIYSKTIVSSGTGTIYASDTIFIITKTQEKEGKDLIGWTFNINIEKSRYVKEKEKIPILVTYGHGISKYSGIFDLAVEYGIIQCPSKGWYDYEGNKMRRKDIEQNNDIMAAIVDEDGFQQFVRDKYQLSDIEIE